ncbi:MAG: preprotein translocase subunit YajC, partial [Micavibrio aeruginosavorus]
MLISQALAQDTPPAPATTAETVVPANDAAALAPPDATSVLVQNVGMIVLLVVMFYFLLIRPQQKRFKEHKEMLDALKTGDTVVIGGGLIGKIDKLVSPEEAIIDLGNGVKVTAVRSSV